MPVFPMPSRRDLASRPGVSRADSAALERAPRQPRRGHGRVTLHDVAQAAGVTAITVSRYLREPTQVAGDTAKRVRDALRATGYVPNKQAGLLASGRSNIVAALLPNLANGIFAETAQGLSDVLQAAGHELLIASTGYSLAREEEQLRALLGWRPAAIVVTGQRHTAGALHLLRDAQAAGTPVIEVWEEHAPAARASPSTRLAAARGEAPPPPFARVGFDHADVGAAMAAHLLAAGHRRLAYVDSSIAEDYRAHERGVAFVAAARAAGAHAEVIGAPPGDAFDAGRQLLDTLLATVAIPGAPSRARGSAASRRPAVTTAHAFTAAAFANDHLACGALLEAADRGVLVPSRLALLGFGDFAIARQLRPALSSVCLPRYEIGMTAARTLLRALEVKTPPASHSVAWRLAERASTRGGTRVD